MRKVIVSEWMSLDGVVQSPSYADEDTSGGFKHGGWHSRYFDERSMQWVVENVSQAGETTCFSSAARSSPPPSSSTISSMSFGS